MMKSSRVVGVVIAFGVAAPLAAHAQALTGVALSPLQVEAACALPPVTIGPREGERSMRVIGSQDTLPRSVFGDRDLLVIDAGAAKGVQLNQQYYLRRPVSPGLFTGARRAVKTTGWVRIVAANEATAIASVDRVCSGIESGDFLEPFVAPAVSAEVVIIDRSGEPDFKDMGLVLFADDERITASPGEYMLIDRGVDHGLAAGARLAIYRDVQQTGMGYDGAMAPGQLPLVSIGEGVVVTIGQTMAVMRIVTARDAVLRGDFVVPRKK